MYCIFKNNRYLSPAKLSSNTMKKKKKLFQLWSGPTQTHHNFFDLKILINPHPLLVDELQRIQRMVDLVKEMRQDIFHRDLRQLQGCKYVGWKFLQHQSPTHPV